MSTDPTKWHVFRFLRKKREADGDNQTSSQSGEQWRSPWQELQRLFSRDSWQAVEELLRDPLSARSMLDRWFGDFSPSRFQPRIDVVDEGQVLRVTVELPGVERQDISVEVEAGALVVRGEKRQDIHSQEAGCYRLERAYGRFVRAIPMPTDADPDHALAKLEGGVLTLTIPKAASERSPGRPIDIV